MASDFSAAFSKLKESETYKKTLAENNKAGEAKSGSSSSSSSCSGSHAVLVNPKQTMEEEDPQDWIVLEEVSNISDEEIESKTANSISSQKGRSSTDTRRRSKERRRTEDQSVQYSRRESTTSSSRSRKELTTSSSRSKKESTTSSSRSRKELTTSSSRSREELTTSSSRSISTQLNQPKSGQRKTDEKSLQHKTSEIQKERSPRRSRGERQETDSRHRSDRTIDFRKRPYSPQKIRDNKRPASLREASPFSETLKRRRHENNDPECRKDQQSPERSKDKRKSMSIQNISPFIEARKRFRPEYDNPELEDLRKSLARNREKPRSRSTREFSPSSKSGNRSGSAHTDPKFGNHPELRLRSRDRQRSMSIRNTSPFPETGSRSGSECIERDHRTHRESGQRSRDESRTVSHHDVSPFPETENSLQSKFIETGARAHWQSWRRSRDESQTISHQDIGPFLEAENRLGSEYIETESGIYRRSQPRSSDEPRTLSHQDNSPFLEAENRLGSEYIETESGIYRRSRSRDKSQSYRDTGPVLYSSNRSSPGYNDSQFENRQVSSQKVSYDKYDRSPSYWDNSPVSDANNRYCQEYSNQRFENIQRSRERSRAKSRSNRDISPYRDINAINRYSPEYNEQHFKNSQRSFHEDRDELTFQDSRSYSETRKSSLDYNDARFDEHQQSLRRGDETQGISFLDCNSWPKSQSRWGPENNAVECGNHEESSQLLQKSKNESQSLSFQHTNPLPVSLSRTIPENDVLKIGNSQQLFQESRNKLQLMPHSGPVSCPDSRLGPKTNASEFGNCQYVTGRKPSLPSRISESQPMLALNTGSVLGTMNRLGPQMNTPNSQQLPLGSRNVSQSMAFKGAGPLLETTNRWGPQNIVMAFQNPQQLPLQGAAPISEVSNKWGPFGMNTVEFKNSQQQPTSLLAAGPIVWGPGQNASEVRNNQQLPQRSGDEPRLMSFHIAKMSSEKLIKWQSEHNSVGSLNQQPLQNNEAQETSASEPFPNSIRKVCVVPRTYPDIFLGDWEFILVKEIILNRIVLAMNDKPEFTEMMHERGALTMYGNEESRVWLDKEVQSMEPWPGAKLKTAFAKNLKYKRRIAKILFHAPIEMREEEPKVILKKLKSQNPNMIKSNWEILSAKKTPLGQTIVCQVSRCALDNLRYRKFMVSLNNQQIKLKNLDVRQPKKLWIENSKNLKPAKAN